jgi:hypothetical protein
MTINKNVCTVQYMYTEGFRETRHTLMLHGVKCPIGEDVMKTTKHRQTLLLLVRLRSEFGLCAVD